MPEPIDVGIEGTFLLPLEAHRDERGQVAEMFRRSWITGMREVLQANLSASRPGVLRGLHVHRRQADYWTILTGSAFVGLFDPRPKSATEGKKAELELAADDLRCLYIPKGVAHGFYTAGGVLLQYLVDEYYTGEDEFGIAWDDPEVGIGWPVSDPILSERDRSNGSLREFLRGAPGAAG